MTDIDISNEVYNVELSDSGVVSFNKTTNSVSFDITVLSWSLSSASDLNYSNTTSGLSAENVQTAIDEVVTVNTLTTAWKSHRTSDLTFTANTWTDIPFELKVSDECLDGVSYLNEGEIDEDKSIIVIDGFNDIFNVSGCIHTLWTGSKGQSGGVFTRILTSTDNGSTWIESRCLQTNDVNERGTNAEGTHPYKGSIRTYNTTWLKLQTRVTSDDMILSSNPVFDAPVTATLTLFNIGNNRETV